ncbi:uncharacterized protein METZ01_LOCUS458173 [marine metagenome]|uniref:Lipoprotein SmpA/OmlA domain-containing protein n=1 Tax=marine metagenome TaxID=408172 RepID=A0A383ACL2_9ZZZZ
MIKIRTIIIVILLIILSGVIGNDMGYDQGFYEGNQLYERIESYNGSQNSSKKQSTSENPWRELEKGMTKNEVRNLLGEPRKINVYKRIDEVWWYSGSKHLEFDIDTGRLVSWSG